MIAAFSRHLPVEYVDLDESPRPRLDTFAITGLSTPSSPCTGIDSSYRLIRSTGRHTRAPGSDELPSRNWPVTFRRHGFDHLVVTGLSLVKHFEEQGIATSWLPKACGGARCRDLG